MKLFDIVNGLVVMNPNSLMIPEFKQIWDRDKAKTKETATREISYIVFLCDFDSPYAVFREEDRDRIVKEDFLGDPGYTPDKLIEAGIAKFKKFQETPTLVLIEAATMAVYKTADELKNVDYKLLDERGKPKYTMDGVLATMSKMSGAVLELRRLRQEAQKEQHESATAKGNTAIGDYEL